MKSHLLADKEAPLHRFADTGRLARDQIHFVGVAQDLNRLFGPAGRLQERFSGHLEASHECSCGLECLDRPR